ncbi:hypothetical protein LUZ61_013299 [Rhynchospora tenuis]|uniref:Disease resistance protein RGA3 n=1 Tax=Rhynchospora tenuis TaxID=198213 RepID=A0AAD5W949_9POAL|nr:hypothetical protein LUZ61_013299 [Rhynchospora tenuis]
MLTKMAEEEVGMLLGVPGEIEKLGRTVGDIQCLLSDAERRQIESKSIEKWLLELTDVMYDADDIMDLCQIKAKERSERHGCSSNFGCGISMLSCLRNPVFAHKIGTQIKELNSRLNEIYERKSKLSLQIESQNDVGPSNVRPVVPVPSAPLADIVGYKIEEDTAMLVKLLTTDDEESVKENVSAVAIVGMAGIGKSTLAKKVFYDPEIQREFPLRILVCVSKDLKEVQLLKCIIREVGGDYSAAEEKSELVPKLARLVENKKFFLVLDDVWPESQEVWNGLLREAMIGGARGSRLLVTTRNDRVARFIQATTTHHVQKLSEEDAWSLLAKQVALNELDSETLKDIGLELVKKCDGLPLAIIAIGGVLRGRGKDIREWQTISKSTLWSMVPDNHYFPQAFYLSYEDLPSYLKQCFIFCSLYPEDHVFFGNDLIYLWLAEGFLCDKGDLSFYETGKEYYKELVWRNLFEVVEELRYLSFVNTNVEVFPEGLRMLKKLIELIGLQPGNNCSSSSNLDDLGTLSLLSCLSLKSLEKVTDISVAKKANLKEKGHLKALSFYYNTDSGCQVSKPIEEKKAAEDVLNALDNLKPRYVMGLLDFEMETLPDYLRKAEAEKLTVWCSKELLVMITSLGVESSEWKKFEHIPRVKFYADDESLYATYQKTPFRFTTNVDSSA